MNIIRTMAVRTIVAGAFFAAFFAALMMSAGTAAADTVNWDAVAQCESGGKWNTNTGNGFYGGLQFKQETWTANGGKGSPHQASRAEQIRVAENVVRTQGLKAWPKCGSKASSWTGPTAPSTGPARTAPVRPGGAVQYVQSTISEIAGLVGQFGR